jgi:hypothetical protein
MKLIIAQMKIHDEELAKAQGQRRLDSNMEHWQEKIVHESRII